jgi:ATP-dependent Lhr-like helicase
MTGTAARARYHSAKQRVSQRLRGQQQEGDIDLWHGRWALLHRLGILGPARSETDLALARARVLLARYGVVTRETLANEPGPWTWDALYDQLGRMELRGEVRRGYFVAGRAGVQFALPQAVEELRAARDRIAAASGDDEPVVINATDPANIFGGAEGMEAAPAFARLPSTHVVIWHGRPIVVAEDSGARLTVVADAAPDLLTRALQAYLSRPNAPRRMTISHWNGVPVLDSAGLAMLQALGFSRTPTALERWT